MRYHILPYSMGGILTGSIIGLSRAIGETAPLITIGALTFVAYLPDFAVRRARSRLRLAAERVHRLPIQMFNLTQPAGHGVPPERGAGGHRADPA